MKIHRTLALLGSLASLACLPPLLVEGSEIRGEEQNDVLDSKMEASPEKLMGDEEDVAAEEDAYVHHHTTKDEHGKGTGYLRGEVQNTIFGEEDDEDEDVLLLNSKHSVGLPNASHRRLGFDSGIDFAEELTKTVVGYIPYVGPFVSLAADALWPHRNGPGLSVWNQIADNVKHTAEKAVEAERIKKTIEDAEKVMKDVKYELFHYTNKPNWDDLKRVLSKCYTALSHLGMEKKHLTDRQKQIAFYELPYAVPFAVFHLGMLREMVIFGGVLPSKTPLELRGISGWETQLRDLARQYQDYFTWIHQEWIKWYPSQVFLDIEMKCYWKGHSDGNDVAWQASVVDKFYRKETKVRRRDYYRISGNYKEVASEYCRSRANRNKLICHSYVGCTKPYGHVHGNNRLPVAVKVQGCSFNGCPWKWGYGLSLKDIDKGGHDESHRKRNSLVSDGKHAMRNLMRKVSGVQAFASVPPVLDRPSRYISEPETPKRTCGGGKVGNGLCPHPTTFTLRWWDPKTCCDLGGHCRSQWDRRCPGGSFFNGFNARTKNSNPCGGGRRGSGICADRSLCCSENGYCGFSGVHCNW